MKSTIKKYKVNFLRDEESEVEEFNSLLMARMFGNEIRRKERGNGLKFISLLNNKNVKLPL